MTNIFLYGESCLHLVSSAKPGIYQSEAISHWFLTPAIPITGDTAAVSYWHHTDALIKQLNMVVIYKNRIDPKWTCGLDSSFTHTRVYAVYGFFFSLNKNVLVEHRHVSSDSVPQVDKTLFYLVSHLTLYHCLPCLQATSPEKPFPTCQVFTETLTVCDSSTVNHLPGCL